MTINKNKPLAKVFLPALLLTATLSLPVESMAAPSPNPRNGQSEKADKHEKRQKKNNNKASQGQSRQSARQEARQDRRADRAERADRPDRNNRGRGEEQSARARQQRDANRERAAELQRQAQARRDAERQRVAQQKAAKVQKQRKVDNDRQADSNRRAFLERQAELNRQRERQAQLDRSAQLQRQAELNRRAELQRQAALRNRAEQQRYGSAERYSRDRNGRYYRDNDGRYYRDRSGRYYDNNGRYYSNGDRYVGNRGRYNYGDSIAVDGHLTNEGYQCQALRDDDGTLYMLVGNTYGLRTGDHARLVGRVVDGGHCDWEGTAFEVTDVRALWADRRHRSVYYHENHDGGRFGHRNNWAGRRARAFENRVEQRYGYYDRDENRYADRYRNDYDNRGGRGGNRQLISREGRLYNNRGCQVLVTGNDEFALTGNLGGRRNGDNVKVTGFLEGPSRCASKTIRVGEIQ